MASGLGTRRREAGTVLLVVIVVLGVVGISAASFAWSSNRLQARAGLHYRRAAALGAAEAGIHRALSVLESVAPDGWSPGRTWRPATYGERFTIGPLEARFTLSVSDGSEGSIVITSTGEAGGVSRRVRARVYLASPALLVALYATSAVRLEDAPAANFVLAYGAGIGDRPWIHVAAGREIWFATSEVSINNPAMEFRASPGPVDRPGDAAPVAPPRPGPARLLLARGAALTLGWERQRIDLERLPAAGIYVQGVLMRADALPSIGDVDRAYYQALATANTANAALNEAAGYYHGDTDLIHKRDAFYSEAQFERLLGYLKAEAPRARLVGVVYIKGGLALTDGQRLEVVDGAVVTEGTIHLIEGASLEVLHSAATRRLPAIIVLDRGALVVNQGARLRAHGLIHVSRAIDIGERAHVDIVGAVVGNDERLSFRNLASQVVIRYDPAVLGTAGLRPPERGPVTAWVAAWEEVP